MLTFLWRFLIFLASLWVIRAFLAFIFPRMRGAGRDQQGGSERSGKPSEMVKDPVCGMYVDPRLAARYQAGGTDLFFCSQECLDKYKASSRK